MDDNKHIMIAGNVLPVNDFREALSEYDQLILDNNTSVVHINPAETLAADYEDAAIHIPGRFFNSKVVAKNRKANKSARIARRQNRK